MHMVCAFRCLYTAINKCLVKIKIASDTYQFCLTSGGKWGGKQMGVTSVVAT